MFKYSSMLLEKKFDFSKLFREYWIRRISGLGGAIIDTMTCVEFRRILTRKSR